MVKTNTELNGKVKYTLTITKDAVISTDIGFPSCSGDDYKPDEAYFVKHNETRIDRKRQKGENSISQALKHTENITPQWEFWSMIMVREKSFTFSRGIYSPQLILSKNA